MLRPLTGIIIILHGLAHLWYFTMSRGWVEYKPEMGWSGKSWLLSNALGEATARSLASVLYGLASLLFVIGGTGMFLQAEWWRTVVIGTAIFSSAVILLYWEGGLQMGIQKGLIGVLLNLAILVALLAFRWPAA